MLIGKRRHGDQHEVLGGLVDSHTGVKNEYSRDMSSACQVCCQMSRHGSAVIRQQHTIRRFAPPEKHRVGSTDRRSAGLSDAPDQEIRSPSEKLDLQGCGDVFIQQIAQVHDMAFSAALRNSRAERIRSTKSALGAFC